MTGVYIPGLANQFTVIPLYPSYAMDESGSVIDIDKHLLVIPWMHPEDDNQPYVTLNVVTENGRDRPKITRDDVSLAVMHKLTYPNATGFGSQKSKQKITIEIEDPEKALRILDRLYPRDWGIQDISNYEVYGWMKKLSDQIQEAMKEGGSDDSGREQGLASNT